MRLHTFLRPSGANSARWGKANDNAHTSLGAFERAQGPPVIAMDWGFTDTAGAEVSEGKADLLATTLFVVDGGTGSPLAVATPGRRAEQTIFWWLW